MVLLLFGVQINFANILFRVFQMHTFSTSRKYPRCLPCQVGKVDWGKLSPCFQHSRISVACSIPCFENDAFEQPREAQSLCYGSCFQFLLKLWFALGLWGYTYLPGLIIFSLKVVQGEKLSIGEEITWMDFLGSWWIISTAHSQILLYFLKQIV